MKNLNVLNEAQRLNKNEMGHVTGGGTYNCECNDRSAVWTATYETASIAGDRAAYWCEGGGSCYPG